MASNLSIELLWEKAHFDPNKKQREAILHAEGPLFLTAGPGSGKTRVLLWRTLNLIVFKNIQPHEIYLSTFTEKAAHQLQEGLRELLSIVTNLNGQPFDLSGMYIGTVHSLCQRILNDQRRFSAEHHHPAPILLDELGQYFHLSRYRTWNSLLATLDREPDIDPNFFVNSLFDYPRMSKHAAVVNCIAFFNRASEECVDPQLAIHKLENPDPHTLAYLEQHSLDAGNLIRIFRLYQTYQQSLMHSQLARNTDFSLLQQEAFKVISTDSALSDANGAFRHVIVDEYQDTNPIQEKIFFTLARHHGNICVVGDDDQALYRFRGATVENFVNFPRRCKKYLNLTPSSIPLYINYRSRAKIIDFYNQFIQSIDWRRGDGRRGYFRVIDKRILAHRTDPQLSVVASTPAKPEQACEQIADLVQRLLHEKKVQDPNQVAFLFPSLKSVQVNRMRTALEQRGLKVYAPRAGRFLEVEESYDVFGLLLLIFGPPQTDGDWGGDFADFNDWLSQIWHNAKDLCRSDPNLKRFVESKQAEIKHASSDFLALTSVVAREKWNPQQDYLPDLMKRKLYEAPSFSDSGKKLLASTYLDQLVANRIQQGRPFSLDYIIKRVTSLDWSVLDLFYRLTGFAHFKSMFDLAESGQDEGPICNLSLISQVLARFVDDFVPIITADLLVDKIFHRVFFFSFLFALFRLGESEYENPEDPFPKGRIPFLTIHQAKGLEFPIVVLGNPSRTLHDPSFVEKAIQPFSLNTDVEPLDRQPIFDAARMFYVALSRAQNLLVIAHFKGRSINEPFKSLLNDHFPRIPDLDLSTIPAFQEKKDDLPRMYSFTADYLHYKKCPRQYMIFRKYAFVPSRAETMFFGSLVHRTLDDLHHELIRRKKELSS